MYDWKPEEITTYLEKNSDSKIIYIEYNYQQLGEDEDWFEDACRSVLNDPVKIKREILLQRMRGSSLSPFEPEELEVLKNYMQKPVHEEYINKFFKVDFYDEIKRDRIYFLGMDFAEGLGQDSTTMTLMDPYTFKPVAEFKSPYIGTKDTVQLVYVLVRKYAPRSIIIPERNRGGAVIEGMLSNPHLRSNVYFDDSMTTFDIDEKLDNQGFLKREAAKRKMYGVYTDRNSRPAMIALLQAHMKDYKDRFVSQNIINDIMSLVRTKTGRIEHAPGFHDDSLFSYLMCLYVYYHGKNLARFGFIPGELPADDERNKGLSYEDVIQELDTDTQRFFADQLFDNNEHTYQEMMKRERSQSVSEMNQLNRILNPTTKVINQDEFGNEDLYDMDLGLFDELNS